MRAYVDSSVVLRIILREPNPLTEWPLIDHYVSSVLLRVECARTIERLRMGEKFSDEQIMQHRLATEAVAVIADLISLDEPILRRAEDAFSAPLKTLDAIHLATALWWRHDHRADLLFTTHDTTLARAARAAGFEVLGA